ncbi:hypothetical protein [Lactiplantibacillus plantarum]|uniref:hypothetical protein n=1 Tax=Lactiplantibacillus plantarum TaxID=1590 RepID=UPI00389AA0E1
MIICKTIGGILMSQSNLEKQEAKLKQLKKKLKKKNIKLNKKILNYGNLNTTKIGKPAKPVPAD